MFCSLAIMSVSFQLNPVLPRSAVQYNYSFFVCICVITCRVYDNTYSIGVMNGNLFALRVGFNFDIALGLY